MRCSLNETIDLQSVSSSFPFLSASLCLCASVSLSHTHVRAHTHAHHSDFRNCPAFACQSLHGEVARAHLFITKCLMKLSLCVTHLLASSLSSLPSCMRLKSHSAACPLAPMLLDFTNSVLPMPSPFWFY